MRVERELARRARQHLGDDLYYSIYDQSRNLVALITDDVARDIIDGRDSGRFRPTTGTVALGDGAARTPAQAYGKCQPLLFVPTRSRSPI